MNLVGTQFSGDTSEKEHAIQEIRDHVYLHDITHKDANILIYSYALCTL